MFFEKILLENEKISHEQGKKIAKCIFDKVLACKI